MRGRLVTDMKAHKLIFSFDSSNNGYNCVTVGGKDGKPCYYYFKAMDETELEKKVATYVCKNSNLTKRSFYTLAEKLTGTIHPERLDNDDDDERTE